MLPAPSVAAQGLSRKIVHVQEVLLAKVMLAVAV